MAQKLAFFENSDQAALIKLHLEETEVLTVENQALRGVLRQSFSEEEIASLLPPPSGDRQLTGETIKRDMADMLAVMKLAVDTEMAALRDEIEKLKAPPPEGADSEVVRALVV
eukprot:3768169-Pyramimonas_sp.AAC.1